MPPSGRRREAHECALTPISLPSLPAIVAEADAQTQFRFLEFFAATIRNPHTRRAYSSDINRFLTWCFDHGITRLSEIHSLHVSTYIELATRTHSAPSVKRKLSATLEPKLVKSNSVETFNKLFDTKHNLDDPHRYMKTNKTECALAIFSATTQISYPKYILDAIAK